MGAANFSRTKNVNNIYTVLMSQYDENDEFIYPFDYDIVDKIEEISATFDELSFEIEKDNYFKDQRILAYQIKSTSYLDVDIELKFYIVMENGYYDGARLDYMVHYYVHGLGYLEIEEDVDSFVDNLFEDVDYPNKGLITIQKRNAIKWINKTFVEMNTIIENAFKQVTDGTFNEVGRFSNGEVVYEKVG